MRTPAIATALLLLLTSCHRETEDDPCTDVVPSVTVAPGAAGEVEVGVDSVPRSLINIGVDANAGQTIAQYTDLRLNAVSIRLIATANDSVIWQKDTVPNNYLFGYSHTVVADSITAPLPCRLRIIADNNCGHSTDVLRNVLLMPD